MSDQTKTKEQLIAELTELRRENTELKQALKNPDRISARSDGSSSPVFSTDVTNKYKFSKLVDIPLLQQLLKSYNLVTGIPLALLDNENNILSAMGWQDICTQFHRVCPQTECRCKQSDSYIADHLYEGHYIGYKCLNGLVDYATPIIIEGQHLATVFHGQFIHEPPDEEFFRRQAREYGFDEAAYMEALSRVPVIPKEQVGSVMEFFSYLGRLLATIGLERKRQLEAARKKAEATLLQSEQKFYKAFHCNPDLMAINTLNEGRYVEINDAFVKITGYERQETIGRTVQDIGIWAQPVEWNLIRQSLRAKQSIRDMEITFCKKTGEQGLGLYSAESIDINGESCVLSALKDVTELKKMEIEMNRLDRLNLVGQIAASIAHELRNPMTTVRGFLQLLRAKPEYTQAVEWFDLMIDELDRANSIITEFLSLANKKTVEMKPRNINVIIENSLSLIQAKAMIRDHYIKLELDDLPDLPLDEKEIRQLIINLVNNGLEAMSSGGNITIKTFTEKRNVVLAVQDEGPGINQELLDQLGTPFFTTKEQGTGLGLSVCQRIANRHNAKIDLETSSAGTTFYVKFANSIGVSENSGHKPV